MTETEKKALALVNEVNGRNWVYLDEPYGDELREALCRAIEQHEAYKQDVSDAMKLMSEKHEAFRQEVSDAVGWWNMEYLLGDDLRKDMARFIISKPDPLVEAWLEAFPGNHIDDAREECAKISATLAARGLEIREKQA